MAKTATRKICLIQGHPHGEGAHLCHALADAYAEGARAAGAQVRRIDIGAMDLPMLRDPSDFATEPPEPIRKAQADVKAADHVVIVYPIWLGTMPAVVKAFFEHLCRAGFAITASTRDGWPRQMLKGKSARVIVTMGMPAAAYRVFFGAHGVKSMESGILGMAGMAPVRETLIGGVGALKSAQVEALKQRMRKLGQRLA